MSFCRLGTYFNRGTFLFLVVLLNSSISTTIFAQGFPFNKEKNQLEVDQPLNPSDKPQPAQNGPNPFNDTEIGLIISDSIPYDISHQKASDILSPDTSNWYFDPVEVQGYDQLQEGLRLQLQSMLQSMRRHARDGQLEKAIEIGNNVYNLAIRFRLNDMKARAIMNLIRVTRFQGNRFKEFELSREAVEVGFAIQDTMLLIRALNSMGQVFKKTDHLEEANKYNRMALEIAEKTGQEKGIAASYTQIGTNHLINENFDSASFYLHRALDMRKKLDQPIQYTQVMVRLGRVFLESNQLDSAQACFERSLEIAYFYDAQLWTGRSYHFLGRVAEERGENELAITHYDSATTYLSRVRDIMLLNLVYEGKSNVYNSMGYSDSAFIFYKRYRTVLDTLESRKNTEAIYGLELTHQINKQERQIDYLNQRKEILSAKREAEAKARIWLFIALGIIVAIAIALYFLFKQRSRLFSQEKKLREADHIRAEQEKLHEKELRLIQQEKFELEMELKNKELTTLTMQMLQKSEDISGLQENLKGLEEKVMGAASQDLNLVNNIRSISRELKSSLGQDQEWDQFKLYFEQVHENFFTHLKNKHPKLTAYDLKLCAYFHMNLGIKQVANIMSVSHDAIKKQRTRMRKKMGLTNEINLLNYLAEVSE